MDQQEFPGATVQNESVDAVVERQHQRGLRAINHEARRALRRARLEEGGEHVVAARPDREDGADRNIVFQIGRSIERIDRNAKRRVRIENSGSSDSSDRMAATGESAARRRITSSAAMIDVLLLIAVGIDAARSPGDAGQRPVRDQVGKLDRRDCQSLDHGGDRSAVRGLRRRLVKMRTQCCTRPSMAAPLVVALFGALPGVLPVGRPLLTTAQIAKLGNFLIFGLTQSFSYDGDAMASRLRGN